MAPVVEVAARLGENAGINHKRNPMRQLFLGWTIGAILTLGPTTLRASDDAGANRLLAGRVAPPTAGVIGHFEAAGMRAVVPHTLTQAERRRVEQALAALPGLHVRVLERHLRHLSFVDGIPGAGTGLTSRVGDTAQFDITLRASVIGESLGAFLGAKEARLFAPDGSGHGVTVEASGADALTYVLLHEATHVVDLALGVTAAPANPFARRIWTERDGKTTNTLLAPLAGSAAAGTRFRGGAPVPAGRALAVYDALAETPFVSLYATAAPAEDLAELVSWHVISAHLGGSVSIIVRDADGGVVKAYHPLDFPAVKARMPAAAHLLGNGAPR